MTVEEKIQALLIADAELTSYVPAERIKVPGDWQDLARPYIIHQPSVPAPAIHTHGEGLQELRLWDFYEVSVYAQTHGEARQIGDLVIAALDGACDAETDRVALVTAKVGTYDAERKIAHVTLDFEVAGALT